MWTATTATPRRRTGSPTMPTSEGWRSSPLEPGLRDDGDRTGGCDGSVHNRHLCQADHTGGTQDCGIWLHSTKWLLGVPGRRQLHGIQRRSWTSQECTDLPARTRDETPWMVLSTRGDQSCEILRDLQLHPDHPGGSDGGVPEGVTGRLYQHDREEDGDPRGRQDPSD